MTIVESVPEPWTAASPAEIMSAAGADDLFVLRRVGSDRFVHLGGVGRSAGRPGIAEIAEHELLGPTAGNEGVIHRDSAEPVHVFGPYFAPHVAIVIVSHDAVVVFGGAESIAAPDGDLIELARFVSAAASPAGNPPLT